MGRHADASGTAVLFLDYGAESVDGEFATTHIKQSASNRTYHIAQEAVRLDGENNLLPHSVPMSLHKVANVGLVVGVELGEASEVIILHQHPRRLVHKLYVGLEIDAAIKSLSKWQTRIGDMILVGARQGGEAGMEIVGNTEDVEDGDVGGEVTVELEDQVLNA